MRPATGLVLALTLTAGTTLGQEPPATGTTGETDAAATAEVDPLTRTRKRVLFLKSGDSLRGRARLEDGRWLVDRKGAREPLAIDTTYVLRVELERDLLAEAKRLERALGRKPTAEQRVEHAAWLLSRGLTTEAVRALDRVLTATPDQPQALVLLERAGPRISLPPLAGITSSESEALADWTRAAARLSPAARELALMQLRAAALGPEILEVHLRSQLVAQTANRRAFAAVALRRLSPGKALQPLARRTVYDGSESVRREAALALGAADRPELVLSYVQLLGSESPLVRSRASEALGNMGYSSAVAPLMGSLAAATGGYKPPAGNIFVGSQTAYVQDFDVEVAQSQSIADPIINVLVEGVVLDARVLASSTYGAASEKAGIRTALGQLTGASPGHTTTAWKKWWAVNEAEWIAKGKAELAGEPAPSAEPGESTADLPN